VEVDAGVAEALATDGPVLLDAVVNRMELADAPQDHGGAGHRGSRLHGQGLLMARPTRSSSWPARTCALTAL